MSEANEIRDGQAIDAFLADPVVAGAIESVKRKFNDLTQCKDSTDAVKQFNQAQALGKVLTEFEAISQNGKLARKKRDEREEKERVDAARKSRAGSPR